MLIAQQLPFQTWKQSLPLNHKASKTLAHPSRTRIRTVRGNFQEGVKSKSSHSNTFLLPSQKVTGDSSFRIPTRRLRWNFPSPLWAITCPEVEKGQKLLTFPSLIFSLVAQMVKSLPAMQETWVRSLVQEDPLKKGVATHSSILAWRIPWRKEPGGLQSMASQRVRHNWATKQQKQTPALSFILTLNFGRALLEQSLQFSYNQINLPFCGLVLISCEERSSTLQVINSFGISLFFNI